MTCLVRIAIALVLAATPVVARAADPAGDLDARLHAIALETGGTLGVKIVHLESGRAAGLNAQGRFPMASVYKLPLAVVVFAKVDAGELSLEQEVEVRPGELRRTGARVDAVEAGLARTARQARRGHDDGERQHGLRRPPAPPRRTARGRCLARCPRLP